MSSLKFVIIFKRIILHLGINKECNTHLKIILEAKNTIPNNTAINQVKKRVTSQKVLEITIILMVLTNLIFFAIFRTKLFGRLHS